MRRAAGANNIMKCPVCGNEFPSIIKECPFCATEKARDNYIDIRESYRPRPPHSVKYLPQRGVHWFRALIICFSTLVAIAACVIYLFDTVNPESWIECFLLTSSAFAFPSFLSYFLWLHLTWKRYRHSSIWKAFTILQIIVITAIICFCIFFAETYTASGIDPDFLYLAAFVAIPLITYIPYKSALKRSLGSDVGTPNQIIPTEESQKDDSAVDNVAPQASPKSIKTTGEIPVILSVCCIIIGIAIGLFAGLSIDQIDRSSTLKYPISKRSFDVNTVYINLKKGNVFHESKRCRLEESLLGISKDSFIEISEYEAILRGFERCPSCYEYATSSDISYLEYEIDNLK